MNIVTLELSCDNCEKHFNSDIMELYISTIGHAMKLQFSSYVHILSKNSSISISSCMNSRMLILRDYALLASINIIYKYCHPWVI